MGGNALKVKTIRLPKDDYEILKTEIIEKMSGMLSTRIEVVPAYFDKPDFGDIDILVEVTNLKDNWRQLVINEFKPTDINYNGSVMSFDYNNFQVDLISVPRNYFETSLVYYSYNDIGNFMGVIANRLYLKYGHDGLSYVCRDKEHHHMVDEISISKDIPYIFDILGFDFERFKKGFKTYEDIYDYIYESKYFKTDMFLRNDDEMGEIEKKRKKKRKGYAGFLEYLKNKPVKNYVTDDIRTEIFARIFTKEVLIKKAEIEAKFEKIKLFNKRFNADLVMEWTGIDKKDLGSFMAALKPKTPEFIQAVLNDEQHAKQTVINLYSSEFNQIKM